MSDFSNDIINAGYGVASQIQGIANQIGQEKENQRARDYNSKEAQKARDYNTWLLQNETQLKAQDARSAGLNPAFMNGAVLSNTPSPSNSPTSPSTTMPIDPQLILSNRLLAAQTENVEAMTSKVNSETEHNKIRNNYLPQLLHNEIRLTSSHIDLNVSGASLNKAQAEQCSQWIGESEMRIGQIVGNLNIMRKQVDLMDLDEKIKRVEAQFKSQEMQAVINNLQASAKLSYTQASDICRTFVYRAWNMVAQAELYASQKSLCDVDADSGRLKLKLDEQYSEADRILSIGKGCVDALEGCSRITKNFVSAAKDVVKMAAPIP